MISCKMGPKPRCTTVALQFSRMKYQMNIMAEVKLERIFRSLAGPCMAIFMSAASAHSVEPRSALLPELVAKVEKDVLENSQAGRSQRLIVKLDISGLLATQDARRQAEASKNPGGQTVEASDAEKNLITEEWKFEISRLTSEIFPNGVRGSARIEQSYSHVPLVVVDVPDFDSLLTILVQPKVKRVYAIPPVHLTGSNNLQLIGQPGALGLGKEGEGTRVAILDTSLHDSGLAEFSAIGTRPACRPTWSNPRYGGDVWNTGNCRIQDALNFTTPEVSELDVYPSSYHMMNVAATVAATAPLTRLSLLQVFDTNGVGQMGAINTALSWVVRNYSNSTRIAAVNMSFQMGGVDGKLYNSPCLDSMLTEVFQELVSVGVIPVVASGNGASLTAVAEPACIPGAVAVVRVHGVPVMPAMDR
jgi:hypothetical protein